LSIPERIDSARRDFALENSEMPVAIILSDRQLTLLTESRIAKQRIVTAPSGLESGMLLYSGLKVMLWRIGGKPVAGAGPAVVGKDVAYKLVEAGLACWA
jgi:hypothetical protein